MSNVMSNNWKNKKMFTCYFRTITF